ncbi:thiamine pyrophosphate-binding protein [Thermomicrobiaceae bacterium CFH 74404]|uniref:Thiamine pyrophosphate-binding protein n=1 Tax=Thermalbibacter longus TaxID=2951981 RepID=A0AA41WFH0_9BACT|nr:thiamine pyrophosphate-binding protein [Thermalbibacter longus]MCM8749128.1 thiamine pyrophosphate-binding protein [Thermalbibacter longus]
MSKRIKGGQAVVEALERLGVEVVFGIPGVHTLEIYDALYDSSIRHVLARHEQGVGFMADGYARASGHPGVAIVITGPGVTNIATPIGEAYADSSPVLVVASNVAQPWQGRMLGYLHDLKDQLGVMRAVTKWSGQARRVEEVPSLLAEAFCQMRHGRPRPVYVEVPLDVLGGFGEVDLDSIGPVRPERPAPPAAAVRLAVAAIERASRVVLYCGGGAVASEASAELVALAEQLGAPVITSIQGKGAVPEDHPLCLGTLWEPGNAVDRLLRQADLALVFGSKLGAQDTGDRQLPLPDTIVRVDIDPEEILRSYLPALAIVADARETARALLEALRSRGIRKESWPVAEVEDVKRQALAGAWGHEHAAYVQALRAAIPRDGILVNDMTMMCYVGNRHYPVYQPRTYLFPTGYGTLGFALPAAIGAKIARPEAAVVAVVGDGGFQYTMQELATAVQFRLGIPIVVFDDSTYTAVKEAQAREYDCRFIAVDLVNPDFIELAASYRIPAVRANSPEELSGAIEEAFTRDLPTLIDVPVCFPV